MAKKLLIVDSDATVQEMIKVTLSGDQYELTFLDDGLSALDLLGKVDPDLILADYHLEGININRFCEKIKQKSTNRERPIMLMVGVSDTYDAKSLFERGVVDFIKKPLQSTTLLEKLRNLSEDSATMVDRSHSAPTAPSEGDNEAGESSKIEQLLGWSLPSDSAGETITQKSAEGEAGSDNDSTMIVMRPPPPAQGNTPTTPPSPRVEEDEGTMIAMRPPPPPAQQPAAETPAEVASPPTSHDTLEAQFPQLYANPDVPGVGTTSTAPQTTVGSLSAEAAGAAVSELARDIIEKVAWDVVPRLAETHYKEGGSSSTPPPGSQETEQTFSPQVSDMAREIIEKVVWEIVPEMAEAMIKEELQKLKPGQPS